MQPCARMRRRYVLAFDASQHRPRITVAVSSHLMPVFHRKLRARKMGARQHAVTERKPGLADAAPCCHTDRLALWRRSIA